MDPTVSPTPNPTRTPTSEPSAKPTRSPVDPDECPMATTRIVSAFNDIAGCGLGCSTQESIVDCRNACEAQNGCVAFSWKPDSSLCTLYDSGSPNDNEGGQIMCAVEESPQCNIRCSGWESYLSGDPHSRNWNGVKHHFQGKMQVDSTSPQQFYLMTPCDHNDRHHQPFSVLGKFVTWAGRTVTVTDYLTLELYDEWDTYYVFLSVDIRRHVNAAKAVSTLYDENVAAGVQMEQISAGNTIVANGRFQLYVNNNEGQDRMNFELTHIPTGCKQTIYMHFQRHFNWKTKRGVNRRRTMHYVKLGLPECYKCTTCGMMGDFKHDCHDPKVTGCDGNDVDMTSARSWHPGTIGWDPTGWTWQKSFVDGESCPDRVAGNAVEMDTFCDEDIETEVIDKCQAARDAQATCCRNIGGTFCDELQDACDIDVCIAASDDYDLLDGLVQSEFTDEVEIECDHQGLFGPVPKLLYEFRGDLKETMSGGESDYTLQAEGDANIEEGALVCDGADYVYSSKNIDLSTRSMEVLVEINNVMVHLVVVNDPDNESYKSYRNGVEMSNKLRDFLAVSSVGERWRVSFCQSVKNNEKIMFGAIYDYALSDQDVKELFRGSIVEFEMDGADWIVEAVGDELLPGQSLLKGQALLSVDRRYLAALRGDGVFVIYDTQENEVVFDAETAKGDMATFGEDGNIVISGANGAAVWHSGSSDDNPQNLVLASNGRLLAFGADGVFWNSNQHQHVPLAAGQGMGVFEDIGAGWELKINGQYIPLETYILYFCAALFVVNVFCGVLYCYNKRARQQYKVVSLGSSTEDNSDVETELEDAKFLQ